MPTREDYMSMVRQSMAATANSSILTETTHRTRSDGSPTDSALRNQYERLERAFRKGLERDRDDVAQCLEREKRFNVDWNRHSRNKIWAKKANVPITLYNGTVEEYKGSQHEIWPRGRDLQKLSIYGQIRDFFLFMWQHTKPYKTVAMIMAMSLLKPFQVAVLGYVAQEVEKDPRGVPLWLYYAGFYALVLERCMYWWYEMWVPLNSQRVQLRCVLLIQRASLPDHHPLASKWPAGRFTGLLKDIDDVINGIWQSCLALFDDLVTMAYLIILCLVNLAASVEKAVGDPTAYGAYVGLFLGLGIVVVGFPFLWFYLFQDTLQITETMVRDGQALYMSASTDAVAMGTADDGFLFPHNDEREAEPSERADKPQTTAIKSYWIYGRTTFRAFFHQLAWKTNFSLISGLFGPLVGYFLLTAEGFGGSFGTSNILVVLLSLKELAILSQKLLDCLVKMGRGCNTLMDVAELLNAKGDIDFEGNDIEEGGGNDSCDGKEEEAIVNEEENGMNAGSGNPLIFGHADETNTGED